MAEKSEKAEQDRLRDLESIDWVEEENSMRGFAKKFGVPVKHNYANFNEFHSAILERGPISVASPIVDVHFFALNGDFDGHIMAVRHSGRNIRRFLIREGLFEMQYGSFQGCLDHIMSNNAVDCELEI